MDRGLESLKKAIEAELAEGGDLNALEPQYKSKLQELARTTHKEPQAQPSTEKMGS